jgi:hypothetical protein
MNRSLEEQIAWYEKRIEKEKKRFDRISYKLGMLRDRLQKLENKKYIEEHRKAMQEAGVICS